VVDYEQCVCEPALEVPSLSLSLSLCEIFLKIEVIEEYWTSDLW